MIFRQCLKSSIQPWVIYHRAHREHWEKNNIYLKEIMKNIIASSQKRGPPQTLFVRIKYYKINSVVSASSAVYELTKLFWFLQKIDEFAVRSYPNLILYWI